MLSGLTRKPVGPHINTVVSKVAIPAMGKHTRNIVGVSAMLGQVIIWVATWLDGGQAFSIHAIQRI